MLLIAEIRRVSSQMMFQRGRRYYQENCVRKMNIDVLDERSGRVQVTGEVRGNGSRYYDTGLEISGEDEILDYTCTCSSSENYWGVCGHGVALAMAFQSRQKKNRIANMMEDTGCIQRNTSDALRQMMYQYTVMKRKSRMPEVNGDVELQCFFQTDPNGMTLECKIGSKRKYVVKNLVKLVRDVEEMRNVRYGSSLEFVHELSAFTEESRKVCQQLASYVAARYPDYQSPYYEMNANGYRYLFLPFNALDGFLDLFLGQSIQVNEQEHMVCIGDPRPTLELRETLGGAELLMEAPMIYPGRDHTYVWKDRCFWRCSEEFAKMVLPVWKVIGRGQSQGYRSQPLFLSREDYGSFCGNILPGLTSYVDIQSGSLSLEDYSPSEPEFMVYLEMPDEETVIAAAKVRYDDVEYDLMPEVEVGGAYRNLEREMDMRDILHRYFREIDSISPEEAARRKRERERAAREEERRKRAMRRQDLWDYGVPSRDLDEETTEDMVSSRADKNAGSAVPDSAYENTMAAVSDHGYENAVPGHGDENSVGVPSGYTRMILEGEEALYHLIDRGLDELQSGAELFVDDSIRRLQVQPSPQVTMGIGFSGNLLEMDVEMDGMDPEEISAILSSYRRRKKYYRMKSGDFLRLEEGSLGTLSELSEGMQLSGRDLASGHVELPMYRALFLEGVLGDAQGTQVHKTTDYRRLIRSMRTYTESDYDVPTGIQATLRRYQKEGFRWLRTLYEYGFGGILADDMGLGKTLQIITLFESICTEAERTHKPMLVVSPASLVYNWEAELQRFAPMLRVQVIAGTAEERRTQIEQAEQYDVNVTSYDLLRRDVEEYKARAFDICVLDEAQYIKNAGTQAAKAVKQLATDHRFALTGTPIENRLSDLWSIFDYLMPGYLYSYNRFRDELETPIVKSNDSVAMVRLQRMATPFILRRKKQDVLKDLPDKLEKNVYVTMTKEQEKIYLAHLNRVRLELEKKNDDQLKQSKLEILKEITLLRRICCSPDLLNLEHYNGGSGKVDACMELLQNAVDGGHHVLVFSQFTSMLEVLKKRWEKLGHRCLYLSGKDSKYHRKLMVEEFQEGEIPVFFISLKAGGTGLNLTAADVVIHCDPWWNVAAQNQATDRAHRIGQTNVVNVMKLVAKGTIEEKILKLQDKKAALADEIVENENVQSHTLDREELMEIFS